jgi:ketosteroid isomerase-like protein
VSQENVEIVRRLVEAFNDRDDEVLASMLDAEIEFESLTMQTYKGSDGLTGYRRNLDDAWAEWRTEGDRFLSAGSETVVHMHRVVGRGKGSDIPVAQDIAILWTLRRGKVVHGRAFLDPQEALKAAGLETGD